jgi:hypothetical protein
LTIASTLATLTKRSTSLPAWKVAQVLRDQERVDD